MYKTALLRMPLLSLSLSLPSSLPSLSLPSFPRSLPVLLTFRNDKKKTSNPQFSPLKDRLSFVNDSFSSARLVPRQINVVLSTNDARKFAARETSARQHAAPVPRPTSVRRIVTEFAHDARHFQLKRPRRRPTEHLAEFLINGGLSSPPPPVKHVTNVKLSNLSFCFYSIKPNGRGVGEWGNKLLKRQKEKKNKNLLKRKHNTYNASW